MDSVQFFDFNLILLLISAGLNLSILIYLFKAKTKETISFSFSIIFLLLWIASVIIFSRYDEGVSVFGFKLAFSSATLLAVSYLYFTLIFTRSKISSFVKKILFGLLPTVAITIILFTDLQIEGIHKVGGDNAAIYGPFYLFFSIYFFFNWILTFYFLFKKLKYSHGRSRLQTQLIIFGSITSLVLGVILNMVFPRLLDITNTSKYGPLSALLFAIFTSYAIIKHRLYDIRIAIRAIVVRLIHATLVGVLLLIITQLYIYLALNSSSQNILFFVLAVTILLLSLYEPLLSFIRHATDSFLFQKEYNRQTLLRDLGKQLTSSLNLDEVLQNLQDTLTEVMRVNYVGFVLWSPEYEGNEDIGFDSGGKEAVHSWGFEHDDGTFEWERDDIVIRELEHTQELIVFDELVRETSETENIGERERKEKILDEMRELQAGVVMPLPASEGLAGVAVLGEKKGGDAFTAGDINTLETLMYQAGVAIENASLFSEVQAFNVKLRKEVARATDDLARKNQSLTILRHLDQVIISSLGIKEMAQKIVDTVSWELGYKGGFMILFDKEKKNLRATALSNTPHYKKVNEMLPINLTDYMLPISADPSNFIIRAVKERKPIYTNDFKDMYMPAIPAELADEIQKEIGARHNLIYPLEAKGEVLGVIIFELKDKYANLSEHEKTLLDAFIDESGIAINNAMLYEELQNVNEQLKNANQRLRELDQMKDELVSVASHELRTPMTAIKGYLYMALHKERENLNENLERYLSISYQSTERLIELVNDMLSVSRLEGKRIELDQKPIDFQNFLKTVFLDLAPKANEKGVELVDESVEDLPQVFADESRLREVLMNLIGNALKFTDEGKVWITAEVVPPHQEGLDKDMVKIGVHDTGKGIDEKQAHKLFTKFGKLQQGSFVKSSEEGGTGLGLYISKGLIELHGGEIWAESEQGEGSHFYFTLPQSNGK